MTAAPLALPAAPITAQPLIRPPPAIVGKTLTYAPYDSAEATRRTFTWRSETAPRRST